MTGDEGEGLFEECAVLGHIEPGRAAGGVGKGDQVELMTTALHAKGSPDDVFQRDFAEQFLDRELTDGDDQLGPQDVDLRVEPGGAIRDLAAIRKAIRSAVRSASGKAARYRTDVHGSAETLLGPADRLEPYEQSRARGMSERPAWLDLVGSGSLTYEHDPGAGNGACDGPPGDVGATPAGIECGEVVVEKAHSSVRNGLTG